jgi:hypothetical protein
MPYINAFSTFKETLEPADFHNQVTVIDTNSTAKPCILRCIAKKALICGIAHALTYPSLILCSRGLSNRSSKRGQEVVVDKPGQVNQRRDLWDSKKFLARELIG